MPSLLILFVCSLLCGCLRSPAETTLTAPVHGDQVWQGDVYVDGDIEIAADARVTVLPGTRVIFLPPTFGRDLLVDHPNFTGSELIVYGRLTAVGSPSAPILFTAPDPMAPPGSWGGINLSGTDKSVFRYCIFSGADSALHAQEATVSVSCSTFRNNRVGVRFFSSLIDIEKNLFEKNDTAIRFHFGAPNIRANLLTENRRGFFITASPHDYRIIGNSIVASRDFSVALGEEVQTTVDLAGNYWGTGDPQEISRHFFDQQRDDYLGRIEFAPFLNRPPLPIGVDACSP